MPSIPVSVWDQIGVVVVYTILLGGLGGLLTKLFTQAIADINAHYASLLKETNQQWQQYIDARSEAANEVSRKMLERMEYLCAALARLSADFERHDARSEGRHGPAN